VNVDYTVYLVTDAPERYVGDLIANVEAAVRGGASVVQYRATSGSGRARYETALELRKLTTRASVPFIINDDVSLALAVDADGVHVGQSDLPPDVVRRLIGPRKLLGLSITAAVQLETVPPDIDYLGVGPVFPTGSKADAAAALGLLELARIVASARRPVVAIGGINLSNAAEVFRAGANGVAVVSAFSYAGDPAEVARALRSAATSSAR
jgi:thiamine-phosphate pyrophosphorylase